MSEINWIKQLLARSRRSALRASILRNGKKPSRFRPYDDPPHLGGVDLLDPEFIDSSPARQRPPYIESPVAVATDDYPDFPGFYCNGPST
jgi:hypothetical protein